MKKYKKLFEQSKDSMIKDYRKKLKHYISNQFKENLLYLSDQLNDSDAKSLRNILVDMGVWS